jgi:uncharacterized protein involved in outer membrane biogenesis
LQQFGVGSMRAIIFILIVAVILIVVAIATGFLDINQIRGARAPQVSATHNGVTAKGGQAPEFDVQTGSVKLESKQTTVQVPTVVVEKPGESQAAAASNNAM